MHSIVPVIMAGGSGTRLWPLSRALYPKQFLALTGRETLFQLAVQRILALADADIASAPPCVVCNEEHRFLVLDQLRETVAPIHNSRKSCRRSGRKMPTRSIRGRVASVMDPRMPRVRPPTALDTTLGIAGSFEPNGC